MGLHASVFCNCYELGKTRTPPPQPELVYVDEETGQISLRWDEPGANEELFHNWLASTCEHGPLGELTTHYLGNVSAIGFLRELLERTPERFPVLLSRVLYNGTHAGDVLKLPDIEALAPEMTALSTLHCADHDNQQVLREFETQMAELVQAARIAQKPIAFE